MTDTEPETRGAGPEELAEAERRLRQWRIATEARKLARSFEQAEEALERWEEADPPPPPERTDLDERHGVSAPPDPMPSTFDDGPEEPEEEPPEPGSFGWGTPARVVTAVGTAALVGYSGAELLRAGLLPEPGISQVAAWLPGVLVALVTAGAAQSLRRTSPAGGVVRSFTAASVFLIGAVFSVAVPALWLLGGAGTPVTAAVASAAVLVLVLAQIPPRAPGPPGRITLAELAARLFPSRPSRQQKVRDRRTAQQWRRERARARETIRDHTEQWQSIHHLCQWEVELGGPQTTALADALYALRGDMFGSELPGDSDSAPGVPGLTGNLEVAVHHLALHHPDRLTRRLREHGERVLEENG